MSKMTKEEFYLERGKTYPFEDREALIRYRRAIEWMDVAKKISVREVGCKFSVIRDLLANFSPDFEYVAVDIDEATLRKINDYDPKMFICHNANNGLPFGDACADYIVCLEVLEHLEDATHFFEEVHRVLKPDGALILSVPNAYCWMEFLDNVRNSPDVEGHITTYTHQNIDALARFCGFRIVDSKGTFTRIPFSRRMFGQYKLLETNNIFLTRSFMYLLRKSTV